MFRPVFHALALAAIAATPAQAFRAVNFHEVNPIDRTTFEVIRRPHSGPAPVWCAAGDYARSVLGLPGNARLYIAKGPSDSVTRPGRVAFRFSTTPPPGVDPNAPKPLTLSLKRVGDNLSVVSAWMYCVDSLPRRP